MSKRDKRDDALMDETALPVPTVALSPKPERKARPGFLLVATNPYCAIDHKGRPCGTCPVDPRDPRYYDPRKGMGEVRGQVGATMVDLGVERHVDKQEEIHCLRASRHDIVWEFQREPFEVPDTRFYRRQIAEGALLDATKDFEAARRLAKVRARCTVEPRWVKR